MGKPSVTLTVAGAPGAVGAVSVPVTFMVTVPVAEHIDGLPLSHVCNIMVHACHSVGSDEYVKLAEIDPLPYAVGNPVTVPAQVPPILLILI